MADFGIMGQVGRGSYADGSNPRARQGADGSLVTIPGQGQYYQLVKDGLVYVAQTAAAGVAPGTAIGTTAAAALYNPAGSGKLLVILKTALAYVSGTLGSGFVSHCVNTNPIAAAVTGTAMTAKNALVGAASGNIGQPLTTATLPAAPTPVRPFCTLTPILASSVTQPYQVIDEIAGEIVLKPGTCHSLQATAGAGTSPLVVYGYMWAEVPE